MRLPLHRQEVSPRGLQRPKEPLRGWHAQADEASKRRRAAADEQRLATRARVLASQAFANPRRNACESEGGAPRLHPARGLPAPDGDPATSDAAASAEAEASSDPADEAGTHDWLPELRLSSAAKLLPADASDVRGMRRELSREERMRERRLSLDTAG